MPFIVGKSQLFSFLQPKSGANNEASTSDSAPKDMSMTEAGKALLKLQHAQRTKLLSLFRNAHAIAKQNRPLTDFIWLGQLDIAKGSESGTTYLNAHKAKEFIGEIILTRFTAVYTSYIDNYINV